MCGIAGIFYKERKPFSKSTIKSEIGQLLDPMKYRGPDNMGFYHNHRGALGHLRLSIIDLSDSANQPMSSPHDKRITIIYNGEIYNYLEIKQQLLNKYQFITNSDTEVILNSYLEWGTDCVKMFNGMWSFAIYDERTDLLFCSRDRMGIKPFYYSITGDRLIFASEIKAFHNLNSFDKKINQNAVMDNMIYGPKPFGETQIKGVFELEAGSNLIFKKDKVHFEKYFKLENTFDYSLKNFSLNEIESLINDSVKLRLRSDVPVATLNSGGLDSSLISAITSKENKKLLTFSVSPELKNGILQPGDESNYSEIIAKFLGTEHFVHRYSEKDFQSIVKNIKYLNDGELYHSNTIPLYMLYREIKKKGITVVLSGEGADEIFRGYSSNFRYTLANFTPKWLFFKIFKHKIKNKEYFTEPFSNYRKGISMMNSLFLNKEMIEKYFNKQYELPEERKELFYIMDQMKPSSAITYFEQKCYLAGLLRRLDRTSMANSIESRVPFLDHRIVEYMNKIPHHKKVGYTRDSVKKILKKVAINYLPKEIVYRRKYGFATPVGKYIQQNNSLNKYDLSNEEKWYFSSIQFDNH